MPRSPVAGTGPGLIPVVQDRHKELHVFAKQGEVMAAGDNVGTLWWSKSHKPPIVELLRNRSVKPYAVT